MPRDLTHVILADDIGQRLNESDRELVGRESDAFHMGAISHDSFLYGSCPKLSTKMHGGLGDDTRAIILSLMDDVRAEKNPAVRDKKKAFTLGFLTHVAVDRTMHPFVYSLSGSQVRENNKNDEGVSRAKARHRYVETWLDMHYIDQKGLNFDNFRPFRKIARDAGNDRKMLTDFFCGNYQKAYNIQDDLSKTYRNGMTIQLFVGKITQNQTFGKMLRRLDNFLGGALMTGVSGFYQEDRKIPKKIVGVTAYVHPVTGKTVHKTLDEMTADAIADGVFLLKTADDYMCTGDRAAFMRRVKNVNLDTGVENTKLADVKQAHPVPLSSLKGTKFRAFMESVPVQTLKSGAQAVHDAVKQRILFQTVKRER